MRKHATAGLLAGLLILGVQASRSVAGPPPQNENYLAREVRHQLVLLPFYTVFDDLSFRVDGSTVTLMGEVVNPTLKSDAEHVVKGVEGVQKVDNQIKVLPLFPSDNGIRRAIYRAIYGYPQFEKYALQAIGPIHIIVDTGHVTLKGVVDSDMDKNLAGIRANGVPGVFSVDNQLLVQNDSHSK